jgi:hypothetical protein
MVAEESSRRTKTEDIFFMMRIEMLLKIWDNPLA